MIDDVLATALASGAHLLAALVRDRVAPDDALARLAALGLAVDAELVWERPDPQGDRHYDLILRHRGLTLSVSACAVRDVPWPMRGVTHWSERDAVVINGEPLTVAEVVTTLDFAWHELGLARHLIDQMILRQTIAGRRVPGLALAVRADGTFEISDDELQDAFDAFRVRHRLEDPGALDAWLADHGLTLAQLEPHVRADAARARVRRAAIGAELGPHLEAHLRDYDRVDVVRGGPFDDAAIAELRREPSRLHALAEASFLAGRPVELALATYARHALDPDHAGALFAASPGEVVVLDGEVARVLRVRAARADDAAIRAAAEARLFAGWLADRRGEATVEWMWGAA